LRRYLDKIAAEPQQFNSILGFVVVETLHDIKDDATGCTDIPLGVNRGLAESCHDAALSIIAAINAAQDLYARYIKALSARGCTTDPQPLKAVGHP
jgi:hypothetical protein